MHGKPTKEDRATRRAVGFELQPPSCGNCTNYPNHKHGDGQERRCKAYNFPIRAGSICDEWTSPKGETLEN